MALRPETASWPWREAGDALAVTSVVAGASAAAQRLPNKLTLKSMATAMALVHTFGTKRCQ